MKIHHVTFVKSAARPEQFPPPSMPEIAFVGRSNVGKSSLINTLVERRNLAKTSNTPGRTQLINFFSVNEAMMLVDLPGYGFAKVPHSIKKRWGEMLDSYFKQRQNLILIVFILDIRRSPNKDDLSLKDWLDDSHIPYLFVLTKTDKLSNNQVLHQKCLIERELGDRVRNKTILFSSKTRRGKEELWQQIDDYIQSILSPQKLTE